MRRRLACGTILAALLGARTVQANCARPVGYSARTVDGGVAVEAENFQARGCPDAEGLLRENVTTGEIVRIDTCEEGDAGESESRRFFDQCVGPGTYRYGFATPYECVASACSTDYFDEVIVTAPITPGCRPYTKAAQVPWGSSSRICSYGSRMLVYGLGFIAVVVLFVSAILYAIVRVLRRRRASS